MLKDFAFALSHLIALSQIVMKMIDAPDVLDKMNEWDEVDEVDEIDTVDVGKVHY